MTLRRRLLLLMLAVLVPTAGLIAAIVVVAYQRELESERRHLRETVRALALVVDREFDKRAAIARTLAVSTGLLEGDHNRFYAEAKAATEGTGNWVVLVDADYQLVNTSVPFGAPLPRRNQSPRQPLAVTGVEVSNLRMGPVLGRQVIAVFTPVPHVVPPHFNVGVAFTPDALQSVLIEQRLPAGWLAAIIDREQTVVARAPDPERWVGQKATALSDALRARPEGFFDSTSGDGIPVRAYYSQSPVYGWTVLIGVPQSTLQAPARQAAFTVGLLAALIGLFAFMLASWSAGRIRRPIEALERAAHELGQDRVPALAPTGIDEADAVGAALHRAGLQAAQVNEELERRVAQAVEAVRRAQLRNEELQRVLAEELLHLITDNLPVLIAYADREGRYRLNNRAYEVWFGRPRAEITGKLVREVVGERQWTHIGPRLLTALAGQPVQFETEFDYPGVGPRRIEVNYIPHRAAGGAVQGVAILVHDITTRHIAHEELRHTEEAQRLLVALHDASRGVRDPVQLQAEIARRVCRHFGVSRCAFGIVDASQEFISVERDHAQGLPSMAGRHRMEDYGDESAAELKQGRTLVVADVRQDARTQQRQAAFDMLQMRSLIIVPLLKEGRLVAVFGLSHHLPHAWSEDEVSLVEQVAERTWFAVESARAEGALRESRNVLSLAMRSARMGAWSRDLVSERVWWSRELEEIFGLAPGAFAGTTNGFRELVHPLDLPLMEQAVERAIEQHEDYSVEFRFRHESGEWRWMDGRGRAVYDPGGQPTMLYGLGIDITARKRNEQELLRLNAELAQAHRRKDEFLATLAHELRNPLAPISNALEILRRTESDAPLAQRSRAIIDRQVQQMTRLIEDLLDIARITRGRVELRRERIALEEIVQAAIESARPLIEAKGHALEVSLPDEPLWLDADPTRLTQVLLNLLNNAAKYTLPGGRIDLQAQAEGAQAVLVVRDTGVGLAPEHLGSVFEMFSQVSPALERTQGGLGIGLALARGLVELHGGSIEARSEGLEQGSTFIVRLPLACVPDAPPAADASASAPPPATSARRVLVVDDNRDAADSLSELLRMQGHDVMQANDGPTALQIAESWQPALALLDIGMPGMNGYELAQRLRALPDGDRIVLAAITGWGQQEDKRRAGAAGFDRHLTKPVDAESLAELLASLADR